MSEQDLVKQLRARPYSNPSYWMLEAADEIERNRATMETQATLISDMRGEIERLKAIIAAKLHQRRCCDCGEVEWTSLLTRAHQSVCSLECPATWKTADGQTHCDLCREITEALR